MMKAVVKAKAEPGLWLEEVPVPNVGGDDVLIPVLKSSICGTDVHIYNWNAWAQKAIPVPMIIGHEFVGVVDRVGERLSNSPWWFDTRPIYLAALRFVRDYLWRRFAHFKLGAHFLNLRGLLFELRNHGLHFAF